MIEQIKQELESKAKIGHHDVYLCETCESRYYDEPYCEECNGRKFSLVPAKSVKLSDALSAIDKVKTEIVKEIDKMIKKNKKYLDESNFCNLCWNSSCEHIDRVNILSELKSKIEGT